MDSDTAQTEHWNEVWQIPDAHSIHPDTYAANGDPVHRAFIQALGAVRNLRVLDVGCGQGELSVYLAKSGANVTALDTSLAAIECTKAMAEFNGVSPRIHLCHGEFSALPSGEAFDLITGSFILHHLEPFDAACRELAVRLAPSGRGVFLENNSRNPLLMLSRRYLVGRFGIAKHGDNSEYLFEPRELQLLAHYFRDVKADVPELIFFRLLNTYIFRYKPMFKPLMLLTNRIDNILYTVLPPIRKYSYRQIVTFQSAETQQ